MPTSSWRCRFAVNGQGARGSLVRGIGGGRRRGRVDRRRGLATCRRYEYRAVAVMGCLLLGIVVVFAEPDRRRSCVLCSIACCLRRRFHGSHERASEIAPTDCDQRPTYWCLVLGAAGGTARRDS
ncbi:uncharacterized protein K452DRAFT_123238 [Aplosporella prunicola CBS 121167]|uniref:Uncharacterized protein n=1 Tax=Aplosporella prunicola CBS 121167 TaxID=1176127 RepID=A0A6A6BSR9_9PEZI|nr:uncharacterized protein K452DRAFT_123238 [Aplosporella prunicola CBS 121167]KAF2145641.1 hypothetical protein K452DRAFT_123238 [Aplosporella prunicola CBS 121167]